jgi:hypothetical protein
LTRWPFRSGVLPVLLFSVAGFLVMGYHPGAEDGAVYLSAVKAKLNPALFPHDAAFFQLQMHASLFDTWMADFVRASGISIAWSELLWQFIAILLIVCASWIILCSLFDDASARWGGLAALSAMFTLPVAGTGIYIADQYLHPRNLATAFILLAVSRILEHRRVQAATLLSIATLLHPMMGAFGVSFCLVLALTLHGTLQQRMRTWRKRRCQPTEMASPIAALIPLGWLFDSPAPGWIDAMQTRHSFWLYQWTWYEWLGAVAPLVLCCLLGRWARKRGEMAVARFASAVLVYGVFQQAVAMILCGPRALVVLSTLEPMRYLQLVYVFLLLIGGGLLGRHILKFRPLRWIPFLLLANAPMVLVQRQLFASSPHVEFPGHPGSSPWLHAFAWIARNTPPDAYFALGPNYLAEPGEDMHSFRALAERSVLADNIKDRSVLSKAPQLVPTWRRQMDAQAGWDRFQSKDFRQLETDFGVNWVVLDHAPPPGLPCPWQERQIRICRIP